MAVDLRSTESTLFAAIDAAGTRGAKSFRERFELGDGHQVEVKVNNFNGALRVTALLNPSGCELGINFWKDGKSWYRLDFHKTPSECVLHQHLESGTQPFDEHVPLPDSCRLSEAISIAFEKAKETVLWKFSGTTIDSGKDFAGFI